MSIRSGAGEPRRTHGLRRAVVGWGMGLGLLAATVSAAPVPDADVLLAEAGLSAGEIAEVHAGQIVRHSIESASERELTSAMAFLVKATPAELVAQSKKALLDQSMADTLRYGTVSSPGTVADFAGLVLKPDAETQARGYLKASPSGDLNLSAEEIAAFQALGSSASVDAVEQEVRKQVLARVQAYRSRGLAGIAPYARSSDGPRSPADALRTATEAAKLLKKYAPAAYQYLLSYPEGKPPGTEEIYRWSQIDAHGEPTIVLTQVLLVPEGDAWVAVQRQYYVSTGYNAEQAIAAMLPAQGGTVMAYANRTSTDQVTGFGGSAKRDIGSKLLSSQLEDMFEKARAKVQQ
jgi:hypothetical protein